MPRLARPVAGRGRRRHNLISPLRFLIMQHSAPAETTPETMLCRTRHMLSSAYSPRTRRPLDPRPQQECVAGAEGPPIKRHESVKSSSVKRV